MKHFYFRDQKVFWKLLIYFWQSVQNTDWSEIWNRMFIFCNDSKFQYPHRSYKLDDVVSWKVSWKLCLNLCSRRWLKPGLNLVSNCIRFRLLQRKTLFSEGRIIFKMLPLKLVRLSELQMFKSSLFHSNTVEETIFEIIVLLPNMK